MKDLRVNWEWVHLLLMMMVAASFRFPGLGTLGFYGDEELSALAVQGILSEGFPHMPSGMAYWRGVPYSYIAAGSALLFGLNEFSIRFPSAVFGTFTIPVFYGFAKQFIGRVPAALAAWLLVFSAWHIDQSREGRMYAIFLAFYLLSLYCFQRAFIDGRKRFILGTILTALFTLTLHEFGIILIALWWIAILLQKEIIKHRGFFLGITFGLGTFWYFLRQFSKFTIPSTVEAVSVESTSRLGLLRLLHIEFAPKLFLVRHIVSHHPFLFGMVIILVILFTWNIWRIHKEPGKFCLWMVLMAGLSIILAILNLFGLFLTGWAIFALWKKDEIKNWLKIKAIRWIACEIVLILLLWCLYGFLIWKGEGIGGPAGFALAKKVVKDIFYYPAMHILIYLESFLIMTALTCIGTALWLFSAQSTNKPATSVQMVFNWFWLPLFAIGFTQEWIALRYTLPLYPFYLMIFAWTLYHMVCLGARTMGRLAPQVSMLFFVGMFIFPITNEQHGVLDAFATSQLSYNQGIPPVIHGFPFHPDHQSAGEHVKANLLDGDLVVAMDVQEQKYYVGRVDYWLQEASNAGRFSYRKDGVQRDIYTNSIVVTSVEDLQKLLDGRGYRRVWLITSGELTDSLAYLIPPGIHEQLLQWNQYKVYVGRDSVTSVYLFR